MTNHNIISQNAEIDLRELVSTLWRGKFFILFLTALFVFFASLHLRNSEKQYLVEYKIKPVGESDTNSTSAGLFASIAGIEVGQNPSNNFVIFKELIPTIEVSEVIFKNEKLIKRIFSNEWNSSLNSFSEPTKSKSQVYISALKEILTGDNEVNYIPPNAQRLAIYISRNIKVVEDKVTGFLSLESETSNPDMLLSIISMVVETTDQIMRQRYINFSKEPMNYYKQKLAASRSSDHRHALAELIIKEEQKLMLASKSKYFSAEPYIRPTISLYPVAPNPKLILGISLMLGLSLGAALILIRHAIRKEN